MCHRFRIQSARAAAWLCLSLVTPGLALAATPAAKPAPKPDLKIEDRVVLITGDKNNATGFKARLAGKFCVISNASVAWTNTKLTITDMKGVELTRTGTRLCRKKTIDRASTVDLVLFELKDAPTEFFDLDAAPETSETSVAGAAAVSAYGNSAKGQVITRTKGRVAGVGPERIEVTIRFVPGNSGSPVVLDADGTLVGVATCAPQATYPTWVTSGAPAAEKRNFATRVDTVKPEDFEKIDPAAYLEDLATLERAAAVNADGIYVATALSSGGAPDLDKIADASLRFQVRQWLEEKRLPNANRRIPALASRARGIQNVLRFPNVLKPGGGTVLLHYERSRQLYEKEKQINATVVERLKKLEEGFRTQSIERKLM